MKTYKWTCAACKVPNIFVHDESREGQIGLNCTRCGEPGVFEKTDEKVVVIQQPGYPAISTEVAAVLSSTISFSDPTRHGLYRG
jgi:hypothetical protein